MRGCGNCVHMIVGFASTSAITSYLHWSCEFESHSWQSVLDANLCDKVYQWHLADLWFSPNIADFFTNLTDCHDVTEIFMFNVTFNNISAISWRSVLLVEEIGVPGENHRPDASHWQTLSHNVVSSTPHHEQVRTLKWIDVQ
jgi:hypothetical protein